MHAQAFLDIVKRERPVSAECRSLLEAFGRITILPHGEVFEVTDRPAHLEVAV